MVPLVQFSQGEVNSPSKEKHNGYPSHYEPDDR